VKTAFLKLAPQVLLSMQFMFWNACS